MKKNKLKKYNLIIKEIEKIRKENNVNWMNILRISLQSSPKETLKVMKQINKADNKISKVFKKLKI